jgi:pimeloyl-ACP methyl ester carboxylesterase
MHETSLLLIHGGANGAWVWDAWRSHLNQLDWQANVLDLRGHGRSLPADFSQMTMEDYVADVASVADQIAKHGNHPVIGGWSMGGLIAMMYVATNPQTPALLLFSPSPPLEVGGRADAAQVRATPSGPFGPEGYGLYINDTAASMQTLHDLTEAEAEEVLQRSEGALESGMARRQRRRGISIAAGAVRCPSLVVYGEADKQFAPELNRRLAVYLGGDVLPVAEAGHWGIVYGERFVRKAAPSLDAWLRRVLV